MKLSDKLKMDDFVGGLGHRLPCSP